MASAAPPTGGTDAALRRLLRMGPREEDNSLLLLGSVALVCSLIAFVPALIESTPAIAAKAPEYSSNQAAIQRAVLSPARVIVPFTPNTMPAER